MWIPPSVATLSILGREYCREIGQLSRSIPTMIPAKYRKKRAIPSRLIPHSYSVLHRQSAGYDFNSVIGFIMVGGELCTDQLWCENFTNKTLQSNNGGETFQARLHGSTY